MRTFILTSIVILLSFRFVFSQTVDFQTIPFSTNAQGPIDFSRLEFLKAELANADIVLLGEPTHSPRYYDIKIQLVKYLHEQLDFDVIAFESGLYQMEAANADIKKGKSCSSAFERGLFPVWTASEEFQQIYSYFDSLRIHKDTFDITGFDCQVSAYYASKQFIDELAIALANSQISFKPKTLQLLQAQFETLETGKNGLTEDFNEESLQALTELAMAIEPIHDLRIYHQSLIGWIGHFGDLYYNNIVEKLNNGTFGPKDGNVRDSLMAANMLYIREQLYPGKKIIGWGANLHFANNIGNLNFDSEDSIKFVPMGYRLKQELGDKVFFLAVTTNNNIPNSIEAELAEKEIALAWIPKSVMNKSFESLSLGSPASGDWHEAVDGILYFNSSDDNIHDKYFYKGIILNEKTNEPVSFAHITLEGTTSGTASDIDGKWFLKIDSSVSDNNVKISCIGFKTTYVSARSLMEKTTIKLTPEVQFLNEVLIEANAPDAVEILQHVIDSIPNNYIQTPFNMEFYSINTTTDTTSNRSFTVESVFESYYQGYYKAAKKNYRILHKRESDEYYMKEKTHGLSQWPMWEVAFNDIFSSHSRYQIVMLESLKKIDPQFVGTELYDGDTVFIIKYNYQVSGVLYISSKDYAVVKHVTTSSGKDYQNRTEIIYEKQNGKYFPYAANGDYLHRYKVEGTNKILKTSNRVRLNRIDVENVNAFEYNKELWYPKNVAYNNEYWDNNYPKMD